MAASLELRQVSKRYPGAESPAVRELSLEVPAGEICVLVGPSGCGKTTVMRMINRLIEPTSGDILVDGQSVHDAEPSELRRRIGYVIQQIGLFPHRTVAQNIATVPQLEGWDRPRIASRVDELLELVGLERSLRDRFPAQLSGGQRQRVGVARALAADPPLMLMDEPFGAIDPIARERLQNEFLRLQAQLGKTVVFVTHDIDEAIKMGDRIAVMQIGGVLAQYAPPEDLLLHPADDFVESFVGADRALKRLSLMRVGDLSLLRRDEVAYNLELDAAGRPLAWVDADGDRSPVTIVERDDTARDALSDLLQSSVQYGAVVDPTGRLVGILSIEVIHGLLERETEASAPS